MRKSGLIFCLWGKFRFRFEAKAKLVFNDDICDLLWYQSRGNRPGWSFTYFLLSFHTTILKQVLHVRSAVALFDKLAQANSHCSFGQQ